MIALAAVVCAALAGLLFPHPSAGPRLTALQPALQPARDRSVPASVSEHRPKAAAALAGLALAVLVGGWPGLVVGAAGAAVCWQVLTRLEPRAVRQRRARLVADLPTAVDLLAACLAGGGSWADSVDAVGAALGGPVGEELTSVAAQVRLGADPVQAWLHLAKDPALAPLARTAARASTSGAALAPTLARLARDQRRTARTAAQARAQAAGVRAVAPLGLCFLPAFVALGIVPAIAGLAQTIALY
ncbi:MAG: type II secretion system F family protein [Streptosporangiaceae bacterium]